MKMSITNKTFNIFSQMAEFEKKAWKKRTKFWTKYSSMLIIMKQPKFCTKKKKQGTLTRQTSDMD